MARMAVVWHLPLPQQIEQRTSGWELAQAGRGSPGAITGRLKLMAVSDRQGNQGQVFPCDPQRWLLSYWAFLTRYPEPRWCYSRLATLGDTRLASGWYWRQRLVQNPRGMGVTE